MAKLDKILKSKSFYVILSVLLGIITWLFVLNYTNPNETRTMEIPLTVLNRNSPTAFDLSDQTVSFPETITVKASGRSDIIGNLSTSDFYTSIDLSQIKDPGVTTLNVSKPDCTRLGIKIDDYYPKTVDMKFDKMTQRNITVNVEHDNTLLRDNYEFVSVTWEPSVIQISGFATEIDEIDCIRVRLSDVLSEGSLDSDRTGSYIGHYILTNGEDVTANYGTEKITVKIEVAKRVPIVYNVTGTPHDDYYVNETNVSPQTVLLRGDADALRNIAEINVGNIDVTGASEDASAAFAVSDFLPAGISAYGTAGITVSAHISSYEVRTLHVDLNSSISTPGKNTAAYVYSFSPTEFSIRVKGKAEDLDGHSAPLLGAVLDLTERGVGEYRIPLEFTFTNIETDKFTVIGEYVCTVTISPHESAITPTPNVPTPSPTPSFTPEPPTETPDVSPSQTGEHNEPTPRPEE